MEVQLGVLGKCSALEYFLQARACGGQRLAFRSISVTILLTYL